MNLKTGRATFLIKRWGVLSVRYGSLNDMPRVIDSIKLFCTESAKYSKGRKCRDCGKALSTSNPNRRCRVHFYEEISESDALVEKRFKKKNRFLYSDGEMGIAKKPVISVLKCSACFNKLYARGFCKHHYQRHLKMKRIAQL